MDKKKFTSWGVGFGSLALVAGMVSYLSFTNNNKNNAVNPPKAIQPTSQNVKQSAPTGSTYTLINSTSNNGGSSAPVNTNQTTNNNNFLSFFNTTTGGS